MSCRMSVKEALAKYGDAMTPHERKEILQYQDEQVYYLGLAASANKVINNENLPNDGFDDENGSYIKVIHDHIGYRYEILQVIGRGSFGQVVKARDHKLNCDVALKIIRNKKRFHQQALIEVKILEHLNRCCEQAAAAQASAAAAALAKSNGAGGLASGGAANTNTNTSASASANANQQQQNSSGSTTGGSSSNTSPSSSNYSLSSSASSLMSSPASANEQQQQASAAEALNLKQQQQQLSSTNAGCQFVIQMINNFYFRNHLCITFELLNMNLYELIKRNSYQGFSLNLIRKFAYSLVQCLRMLARERIIHCDLKPENILLRDRTSSAIKVIDFGSSCFTNQRIYTYIQSRFYRSPEVILGLPYGTAIDMWSLACILVELYTGEPLFAGENESDQLGCIMEVCSLPPASVLEAATRRRLFFDSKNNPRNLVNSKDKRRRVGSRPLSVILNCDEGDFIDFLERCLEWDPRLRLTPDEALRHPWLAHYVRRVVGSYAAAAPQSALVAQHQLLGGPAGSNAGGRNLSQSSSGVSSGGSESSASAASSAAANILESMRSAKAGGGATAAAASRQQLLAQRAASFLHRNQLAGQQQQPMQQDFQHEQQQQVSTTTSDEHEMEVDTNNNSKPYAFSCLAAAAAAAQQHSPKQTGGGAANFGAALGYQPQRQAQHFAAQAAPQRGLLSVVGAGGHQQTATSATIDEEPPQQQAPQRDSHLMLSGTNPKQAIINANKQFISASARSEQQQDTFESERMMMNPLNRLNRDLSGNVVRRVSCVAAPACSNLLVSNGESCVNTVVSSSSNGTGGAICCVDPLNEQTSLSNAPSTLTVSSVRFGGSGGLSCNGDGNGGGGPIQMRNLGGAGGGGSGLVTSATCVIRDSNVLANKSQAQPTNLTATRQRKSSLQQPQPQNFCARLAGNQQQQSPQHLAHSNSARSLCRLGEDNQVEQTTAGSKFDFANFHAFNQFNGGGGGGCAKGAAAQQQQINQSPSSVSLSAMNISTPTNCLSGGGANSNQASSGHLKLTESDLKLSLDQVQLMLSQAAAAQANSNGGSANCATQANQSNHLQRQPVAGNGGGGDHVAFINSAKQLNKVIGNLVGRKNSLGRNNYFTQQQQRFLNSNDSKISSTTANNPQQVEVQKPPRAIVKRNPYITSEQFSQWNSANNNNSNNSNPQNGNSNGSNNIDTTTAHN